MNFRRYLTILFIISVVVLYGCRYPVSNDVPGGVGYLRLELVEELPEGMQRTILPSLPVVSYRISFDDGPVAKDPITTDDDTPLVELDFGVWDITIEGLDGEEVPVAVGTAVDVVIESGQTTQIAIELEGLTTGTGTIDVTVTWPLSVGVETGSIVVELDDVEVVDVAYLTVTDTSVRYEEEKDAGEYRLLVSLPTGGAFPTVVMECVHVYGNVTTASMIELTVEDFTAPPSAPVGLSAVAGSDVIDLTWTDTSSVETGYGVERKEEGGSYGIIESSLPENSESYTDSTAVKGITYFYRVFAFNSFGSSGYSNEVESGIYISVIIADHTIVADYSLIPQQYIDIVKTMLFNIPGESHGGGYIYGLELLEAEDSRFAVSATWDGEPEPYSDQHLRVVRTYRNQYSNWSTTGGEEDFFTNTDAIDLMKNHLTYMEDTLNNSVSAFGFGWCWDMTWHNLPGGDVDPFYGVHWAGASEGGPDGDLRWGIDDGDYILTGNTVNLYTYIDAVLEYNEHEPDTETFFTTGPVDGNANENGYQRYLKHQEIREYVQNNGGVLFDYADILCWNDDGDQYTIVWDEHEFQIGHPDNTIGGTGYDGGHGGCHIEPAGCLRLGKAIWWMLARLAGWDGQGV